MYTPSTAPLYLSPHFDDVCFSLSHFSRGLTQGTLVNLFTRSTYTKAHAQAGVAPARLEDFVSDVRKNEDLAFCNIRNLEQINLDLPDAGLGGANPFDLIGIAEEEHTLAEKLIPLVSRKLLSAGVRTTLLCPLGIGGHRNHLSTFNVVMAYHKQLKQQGADIGFYEDIPYASYADKRAARLAEILPALEYLGYSRTEAWLDGEAVMQKGRDIVLYASQFEQNPTPMMSKYFPRLDATSENSPHEAIWLASGAGLPQTAR